MKTITLGKTNLTVPQLAFGALPIQRTELSLAVRILRKAFDNGITFFDTARGYSDSEAKLGQAFAGIRQQVVIATKTGADDAATVQAHLETSLKNLRTDYIDLIQLHNPAKLPNPDDPDSNYAALRRAREKGQVRFIGLTNHRSAVAREGAVSGLYDTVQFPLSYISSADELSLIELCHTHNVGLIAMKALCGGMLTNIPAAFAFFRQYDRVLPIWGIQHERELDEFLALEKNPPPLTAALQQAIEDDRSALAGSFCRGCGYCLPCPNDIPIPMAARMALLLRRAPYQQFLTPEWREKMHRIEQCNRCGHCSAHCPYGLETPKLLQAMLKDYDEFSAAHY